MFGYVRPYKPYLRVCENELFEAVYCGLCRTIRRRYGAFATFALSYDLAFLAALGIGLGGTKLTVGRCRCAVSPIAGKNCVFRTDGREGELEYAADCQMILTFNKLLDDLSDKRLSSRARAAVLLPAALPYYMSGCRKRPRLARAIRSAMKEQRRTERSRTRSVDRLSEPTAAMMRAVFCELGGCDPDKRTRLGEMGYMLGRFVYICDAIDDLEKDLGSGDANPFLPKTAGGSGNLTEIREHAVRKAGISAELTLGALANIYAGLPENSMRPITDNIIYLGLRHSFEEAAAPRKKKKQKKRSLSGLWRGRRL